MIEEKECKDGGASGNIQELECVDGCPGCCGIPAMDPTDGDSKDPNDDSP